MFGGTTRKLSNACCPHRKNSYRSLLRANSTSTFLASESAAPKKSTCTEWSITKSTGMSGLIFLGSPPRTFMASRIAARSTTAGTPVKSCNTTRAGLKGTSSSAGLAAFQFARFRTSASVTWYPSQFRSTASSKTRIEKGSFETGAIPSFSSLLRR